MDKKIAVSDCCRDACSLLPPLIPDGPIGILGLVSHVHKQQLFCWGFQPLTLQHFDLEHFLLQCHAEHCYTEISILHELMR